MNDLSKRLKRKLAAWRRWDVYAFVLMGMAVMLQAAVWPKMPLFMDCYYHLAVMQGFNDAGGWVGTAFWEYAPYGRPHLYPPLFHLLESAVSKCGADPITVARLFQFLIYPVFLIAAWGFLRRFYSKETAFFGLLLLFSSFALYLAIVIYIPFSLAFLLGILSYCFLEKSKNLSAAIALALAFYAHHLMAWLLFLAFLLYGLFWRARLRSCLSVCLLAVLGALPFLWHQMRFMSHVKIQRALEFYFAHINILLIVFAFAGLLVCLRRQRQHFFLIALGASMFLLLFVYRNRFLSGQGLVPLCFLGAAWLDFFWQHWAKTKRSRGFFFFASLALPFYFFTPVLELSPLGPLPEFRLISRLPKEEKEERPTEWRDDVFQQEETFYHPRFINDVVRLIRDNSGERDIIFSNFNYAGGMFAVLSHRAMSNAMLSEVGPFVPFDEIGHARLILWFKRPDGRFPAELPFLVRRYGLKKIGETDIVHLYLNERSRFQSTVIAARVPYRVCGVLFLLVFLAVVVEQKAAFKNKSVITKSIG